MSTDGQPTVGVVIPTHARPQLMRKALDSVLGQTYPGHIEVVIVFDRTEPDLELEHESPNRRVTVMTNDRTPGLAGARNTGVLRLETDLIAFCDDDDTWSSEKLVAQVTRLADKPDATFVTTAMQVHWEDHSTVRLAGRAEVTTTQLARSRMAMLHSSSFVFKRSAMLGADGFGLVDETLPNSMSEDWDFLLRASRSQPIQHVDEPLTHVLWGQSSYFSQSWRDKNLAHEQLLAQHPEIRSDRKAAGHMLGKIAFGHAALGNRADALRTAWQAAKQNWRESRTPIALLVVAGASPSWILRQLNKRGHGI